MLQQTSLEIFKQKYAFGEEQVPEDSFHRIAYALAKLESIEGTRHLEGKEVFLSVEGLSLHQTYWYYQFLEALNNGAIPAGRIASNIGAEEAKPNTSLINCTVSRNIPDSIEGIAQTLKEAMLTLAKGCGIGFCASSLRPKGAFVNGVGAETSGSLSFLEIWDTMCKTIASAGGRRGAMMLTMHCWHPDIYEFVTKKHEVGKFRQFNLSVLVTDDFMEAVRNDDEWKLYFPLHTKELKTNKSTWVANFPFKSNDYITRENGDILCQVYKTVKARELWDLIMKSTYNYAEPAIIAIGLYNKANPLNCAETIVATNPCGEQGLPEFGSCLLGSVILSKFVRNPFKLDYSPITNPLSGSLKFYTDGVAYFDWKSFDKTVRTFVRMLDNVVELHGLALPEQAHEIKHKRRHGMGYTGLGTTLNLLGMKYGSPEAVEFCEEVTKRLAVINLEENYKLGEEKGGAPIFEDGDIYSEWLNHPFTQKVIEESQLRLTIAGGMRPRFTHATSIAPTGTISLAFGNNCSNGIEPSFAHSYFRNVIIPNKKTKKRVEVLSEEALLWRELHGDTQYPEWFITTQDISPDAHIAMQASAQKWVDSSISKTINCPSYISFETFKDIYLKAYDAGLKGVTTYRPSGGFTAVLQTSEHLETIYEFALEDGTTVKAKANDTIWYDGEEHEVENLFCALNEGYYGKL